MKKSNFTKEQWGRVWASTRRGDGFGFPRRRRKSILAGTFNIRSLGQVANRSSESWLFLAHICKQFDLLAIQEVSDNLEGLQFLMKTMGRGFKLAVSDVTGAAPGRRGKTERLAFVYRNSTVQMGPLASDITYDKTYTLDSLAENDKEWVDWLVGAEKRVPSFVGFIRTPHCVAFEIKGRNGADPYRFTTVNAHLLYGQDKRERKWEFDALVSWLYTRAKKDDRMLFPDILMMGDCNVEFEDLGIKRYEVDALLKGLNARLLKSRSPARVNFPLLSSHPEHGMLRTNARMTETYDQIALFMRDKRLPGYELNRTAGDDYNGWDYGVFNFTEAFAHAVYYQSWNSLFYQEQRKLAKMFQWEVSDHFPVWMRLPIPGA